MTKRRFRRQRGKVPQPTSPASPSAPSRRKFLKWVLAGGGAFVGGALLASRHDIKGLVLRVRSKLLLSRMAKRGKLFAQNFHANRQLVDSFIKSKAAEIIRGSRSTVERGGVIFLARGKPVLEWVEDYSDIVATRVFWQLNSADARKMSLEDFDYCIELCRKTIRESNITEAEPFLAELDAIRNRIALAHAGRASPVLSEQEARLFRENADIIKGIASATYDSSAHDRAMELSKNPDNKVITNFHTHNLGEKTEREPPSAADIAGTAFGPQIVFSILKDRMDVYYIIEQNCELAFSIPIR